MKKLMIAAAAVAMIGMEAQAAKAQVYDVKLLAKSTYVAVGDLAPNLNPFVKAGQNGLVYRRIGTTAYTGAIWGCDCDAIAAMTEREVMPVYDTDGNLINSYNHWEGAALWRDADGQCVWVGPTTNEVAGATGIWDFINAIEGWGDYCEGAWWVTPIGNACRVDTNGKSYVSTNDSERIFGYLQGAGFGTLANDWTTAGNTNGQPCAISYVQQMSGYFAGYLAAPYWVTDERQELCVYCQGIVTPASCTASAAWDFCACVPFADPARTAAFGEWYLNFNAGHAATLENYPDALDCLAFPKDVKKAVYYKRISALDATADAAEIAAIKAKIAAL